MQQEKYFMTVKDGDLSIKFIQSKRKHVMLADPKSVSDV